MSERIRKAWIVRVRGYDEPCFFFGPTREKAKRAAWLSLSDACAIQWLDISAKRAPWRDVKLPPRDPVADQLSSEEAHCLLHAFGGAHDPYKAGYRDYFYTRRDDPPLVALTERSLMAPMAGDKWGENMTYFVMTERGKQIALSMTPEYAP